MFYGKPLHIAYASPRGERSRLVLESVGRSSGGPLSSRDCMRLLEDHINPPLDRSRVGDSPRQGVAAASGGTARSGSSSEVSPRGPAGNLL